MKNNQAIIPSVNFHLWEPCNMRCKFCFAGFKDVKRSILPKGHIPKEDAIEIVRLLGLYGFEKITFAGGEPTLCPWLPELIKQARLSGLVTMLVTNGSRLTQDYLLQYKGTLDWIVLSIDSCNPETNKRSGRHLAGKGFNKIEYQRIAGLVRQNGFRLKVNTVVHQLNKDEDLKTLISEMKPERWKILKVLSVEDQNGSYYPDFEISDSEFQEYLSRNSNGNDNIKEIAENNEEMRGSYLMIDPAGRFFDNVQGTHCYSASILSVGVQKALADVNFDLTKFEKRGGLYQW